MRNHRPVLALGLVGALALSGCSGGDDAVPEPPAGWVRLEEGRLSVAVPESWVEVPGGGDGWTTGRADAPLDEATIVLVVRPDHGDQGADMGVSTFVAGAQVGGTPGYSSVSRSTPVETDTLVVERNDFLYGEGAEEYEGVFWAASDPADDRTVALQLTARDIPDDVAEAIEQSIRVLPEPPAEG